tara:strand:+ start:67 stop:234 length:168 start_codon:yes stop_codon:yes gene_type:complete
MDERKDRLKRGIKYIEDILRGYRFKDQIPEEQIYDIYYTIGAAEQALGINKEEEE